MQNNFAGMQEDALRRAREMYSRSRNNFPASNNQVKKEKQEKEEVKINREFKENKVQKKSDVFEFLLKDPDKTIILALMIILSGEKTDSSLLFALMYLLT